MASGFGVSTYKGASTYGTSSYRASTYGASTYGTSIAPTTWISPSGGVQATPRIAPFGGVQPATTRISAPITSSMTSAPMTTIKSAPMASIASAPRVTSFASAPSQIISPKTFTSAAPVTTILQAPMVATRAAPVSTSTGPSNLLRMGEVVSERIVSLEELASVGRYEAAPEVAIVTQGVGMQNFVSAAPSAQYVTAAPAQEYVTEATEQLPRYMQVFMGQADAPVYQSHHFDSTKWNSVQTRDDDIIVLTAYKSGTTWMQQILAEIIFQDQEKPATVGDMSPWVDLRVPPAEVIAPVIEGQTWRRFLKTHLPADAFLPYYNQSAKYIYVARDGRDAFMSLMNHYEKGNDAFYGALNEAPGLVGDKLPRWAEVAPPEMLFDTWLAEGWPTLEGETDGWPFWSYFKNVKTWWALAFGNFGVNNILFVHFNDMKKDLDGEMRRIAEFLEVPIQEARWADCVQACTFEAMQANADVVAPLNGSLWEGGGKSFIFKGTNERWRGVLSDEQVAAYEQKALDELGEDCARFMALGSLP